MQNQSKLIQNQGGGNVMCVGLYPKSVCTVYRTKGVYCRYMQYIQISAFVKSRRVHLFTADCLYYLYI